MQPLRTSLATAMLVLATGGTAQAAEPWSAPLTLGPPSNGSEATGIGFGPRGDGLLSWRLHTTSFVASLRGDGALGPPRTLPADLAAGPALAAGGPLPTLPATGRAIIVMRRLLSTPTPVGATTPVDRTRLTWAVVRPDATLGRVHTLTVADCLTCRVRLAVNWLGDAIVAWRDDRGVTRASWSPGRASPRAPPRTR